MFLKFLFLIIAIQLFVGRISCDVESTINYAVPKILSNMIEAQKIPSGAYSLFQILERQVLEEETHKEFLRLDVRNLNNQTNIILEATVNTETADVFTWKYNCGQNNHKSLSRELTFNMPFFWIDYAVNASSKFCKANPDNLDETAGVYETFDISVLNYETQTFYRQVLDGNFDYNKWGSISSLNVGFASDVIRISAAFNYDPYATYAQTTYNMLYQPCTGAMLVAVDMS